MASARNDDERTDPGSRQGRTDSRIRAMAGTGGPGTPPGHGEFGFDFDAFERSEAEAASRNPAPQTAPVERPPERRTIIPRNWLPPGDAVVETRPIGNMTVVTLRGRINESFRGAELGQSLHGIVVFDLSQVDRISSFGVKGWLQMLEQARFTHCYFFRCSEAVINQVTMMRNFCGAGRIHSLLVPYLCGACGEEFNVVYEGVADREAILGRSPVPVECPRCASAARMADDPWAYLAVDDHLLQDVPADLDQVLEHLTQIQRVDPIEKFVSDDETRVRINVPLDARLRLNRALTGLEGRVVFDLTPRPELSSGGVQRLTEAIRELESEVTEVWLDGATPALIEALLQDPPPRTWVSTAWITALSPDTGIRRPVLIDLRKKRAALLRGEVPAVDAGWARGALTFESTEALFQAARHLQPPARASHHATPTPAPIAPAPFATSQPRQMHAAHIHPGHTHPGSRPAPYPAVHATSPGFPAVPPAAPQRSLLRSPMFIWQVATFLAATALLASVAFTAVFYVAYTWFATGDGGLSTAATQQVMPALPQGEGWDGVSALPPAWVEQQIVADDGGVRGTGVGKGATPEEAIDASRTQAVYRLIQHVSQRLQRSVVIGAVGMDPGPEAAPEVVARFLGDVGTWATPVRVASSVKVERDGTYTVATQHQLDPATMQRVIDYYSNTAEFRGLTVARRFPFRSDAEGLVVVKLESWFRGADPGDPVLELDRKQIVTLEDYLRITDEAWDATPEGGKMVLYVLSGGKRSPVEFVRAASSTTPRHQPDPKIELLPLELGR